LRIRVVREFASGNLDSAVLAARATTQQFSRGTANYTATPIPPCGQHGDVHRRHEFEVAILSLRISVRRPPKFR